MLSGKFIGVKEKANTFTVEKKFIIKDKQKAVLKITALGLYFAEINGVRVGDRYLTPGWTSYNKTLQVQEYDVTELLRIGENIIRITVNTGWYCGRLTWNSKTDTYGEQSAVCADIFVDGVNVLSTDTDFSQLERDKNARKLRRNADAQIRRDTHSWRVLHG